MPEALPTNDNDRRLAKRYRWSSEAGRLDPAVLPVRWAQEHGVPIRNISSTGVLVGNLKVPPERPVLVLETNEVPPHRIEVEVSYSESRFEGLVFSISPEQRDTVQSVLDRLSRGGVITPMGGRRPEWSAHVGQDPCFENDQCPIWPNFCKVCGVDVPRVHRTACERGHALPYPNIVEACRPERRRAVRAAFDTSTTHWSAAQRVEALEIVKTSVAVLACDAELLLSVLWGHAKFHNYLDMVARNERPPDREGWDLPRDVYDESTFPGYKEQIRFAALSLDGRGVRNFGPCFATLREDVLREKASVFVENSFFARERAVDPLNPLPAARASWLHREVLALAKLATRLPTPLDRKTLESAILVDGRWRNPREDEFVEVHIFGPIGAEAVTEVSVLQNEAKLEDVREACQRNRIGFRVREVT